MININLTANGGAGNIELAPNPAHIRQFAEIVCQDLKSDERVELYNLVILSSAAVPSAAAQPTLNADGFLRHFFE